jgi:hypothetical protein
VLLRDVGAGTRHRVIDLLASRKHAEPSPLVDGFFARSGTQFGPNFKFYGSTMIALQYS